MLLGSRTTNTVVTIAVSSGGTGYTSSPTVAISGGGGTGASAVAIVAGSMVDSVRVVSGGTGYTAPPTITFSGGGGTSASAGAFVYNATLNPMTFFRGRNGDTYGVDGMGRGVRWNGTDASVQPIGLAHPASPPAVTASTSDAGKFVAAVQLVNAGGGYHAIPTVSITGGTPDWPAKAEAYLINGRVAQIRVTDTGSGYKANPTVSISSGIGTGASFTVGVLGSVRGLTVTSDGTGYTTTPQFTAGGTVLTSPNHGLSFGSAVTFTSLTAALTGGTEVSTFTQYYALTCTSATLQVGTTGATTASPVSLGTITSGRIQIPGPRLQFSTAQGLTGAAGRAEPSQDGNLSYVELLSAGTGATTSGVTVAVTGGAGTGAALRVAMQYSVATVTVVSSGTEFYTPPVITIRAATNDPYGSGGGVTSTVNSSGNISSVAVAAGGVYLEPPSALILNTAAKATALLAAPLGGKYFCAIRYIDGTPETAGGPIPSSISELTEVDAPSQCGSLTWTFTHPAVDDRVTGMELWRTSSNQSVLLYRVATIPRANFANTYVDSLSEAMLTDQARDGYGLMPVTLPSGQVNARRFEIPPPELAVGCLFQDRAWYAVDTTGRHPNTLLYSEIDEPESVPTENELVLQENSGEPDKIVALVPLASALLVVQQAHLYRLTYVAQPVLDAAVVLASSRGILNSRCWGIIGGVAFLVDSLGAYAFDGQNEEPISIAVDDYWRNKIIDFSKANQFHVRCDPQTRVMRFYYCKADDVSPGRALCYCVATKAWWEETYPSPVTASTGLVVGSAYESVYGTGGGSFVRAGGTSDGGASVPYEMRTGAFAITPEPDKSVAILYRPTEDASTLHLGMHYNNSPSPRQNAIASDRGSGFVSAGTLSSLNLSKTRSALADANGFARAYFSGRLDDRSAGGDRHVAAAISGAQSQGTVAFYAVTVSGVTT